MTSEWIYVLTAAVLCSNISSTSGLRFTTEPEDSVAVIARSFWWDCVAYDDTQSVSYSWSFNGQALPLRLDQTIYNNGTLHIKKLQYDDVGVYICTATSSDGTTLQSRETTLDIAYISMTFSTSPQPQTVFLGEDVVLSCLIDSLPKATITWTLNGDAVTMGTINVSTDGTSLLSLSPIMYQRAGLYKCMGTNQMLGVYRYSLEANVIVKGHPVFLSSLEAVAVPLGFTATFNCHFHGNPEPKIGWLSHTLHSDSSVTSKEIQNSDKYSVTQNGTFHIYNVVQEDEAFYSCRVYNVFGEMSESAQLTVTGEASVPEITEPPQNLTVTQGSNATFSCNCTGNPEPHIYWTYNDDFLVTNDHVTSSANGTLIISNVQSSDMGWYTCFCENAVGAVNQSGYMNIQVAAAIVITPQDVTVLAGEDFTLHCEADGNPTPTVSWVMPGSVTIDSTKSLEGVTLHRNGSLVVTSATTVHAGMYVCTARNVAGSVTRTAVAKIEYPPVITKLPVSQGVNQGDKAFLHCRALGSPAPTYTWSKDGEGTLTSTEERQIYLNNTLVIHSVTLADAGVYTCKAYNVRGQVSAVASLTVSVLPSFTTKPANQTTRIGSTVQLRCVAIGNPVPTQKWNKDGRLLQLDDNMEVLPDNSLLTIATIRQSQFGEYTCIASNMAGTNMASAWIKADDLPVFTFIPQNATVNQSGSLFLHCQGRANEAPSISWYIIISGVITVIEQGNGRVTVAENGTLIIQNVEQPDEGLYMCVIANTAGQISTNVYVNVQVPPTITSTNSPQTIVYQSPVTLTCQSTGDPDPITEWISPHGEVITASPAYQISVHSLKIASANEYDDTGSWICKSCNLLGCDQSVIVVSVEGRPLIQDYQGRKNGNTVILECTATGLPSPTVTFTSKGQTVTSQVQGHFINGNMLQVDEDYVRTEYSCRAQNRHGTVTRSFSVSSPVEAPSITNIQSRWITLRWTQPVDQSNLPLTGYKIQLTSDLGISWLDVSDTGSDLLTLEHQNITELMPYTDYSFRVIGINILGAGEPGDMSTTVRTLADAPSPPTALVAVILDDDIVLLSWKPPLHNNGPYGDIVYEYKVTKPGVQDEEVVHNQGVVFSNQSLHTDIQDVNEAVLYTVSVWAVNMNLKKSSQPAIITMDMTVQVPLPGDADSQTLGPDKIVAIVFGAIGGVVIVFILIFVVSHIRNHKKTESLSFIRPRLSLDQFYMENPKTLYSKESRNSKKRRSGQGFYKFDNNDIFHGNGSSHEDNGFFSGKKGPIIDSDVLLVARNPLYQETELMDPANNSSRVGSTELLVPDDLLQSFAQDEMEIPMAEITENFVLKPAESRDDTSQDGKPETDKVAGKDSDAAKDPLTPLSAKDLEADIMAIYSTVTQSPVSEPDQSFDHVYSSIHSERQSPQSQGYTSSVSSNKSSNCNSPKPPITVLSPDKLRSSGRSTPVHEGQSSRPPVASSPTISNKSSNSKKSNYSRLSKNRSVSPISNQSSNSYSPKPPIKVLSLKNLRPASENSNNGSQNSANHDMEIPFEMYSSHRSESQNTSERYSAQGSENHNTSGDSAVVEFPDISFGNESTSSSKLKNLSFESENQSSKISDRSFHMDEEAQRPRGIKIEDNYLTEEEVLNEVASAELY